MNDKELFQQKKQAQLDEWKADLDKLKAKASMASADIQIRINEQIKTLEDKFNDGDSMLSKLKESAEETYESMKTGVESAWDKIASIFNDVKEKFKS
jgi:uncharacterized membrane-anchored protein YhcB (DUF1043 family)